MDVHVVAHAVATPTRCAFCTTHAHPEGFLERGVEIPGYGRVYECVGCARDAGKAAGMVAGSELRHALEQLAEQDAQLVALRAELAVANAPENKVVTLGEAIELAKVIDLDAERRKRRPATTSTKHRAG